MPPRSSKASNSRGRRPDLAILVVDWRERIMAVDDDFLQLAGYAKHELEGLELTQLVRFDSPSGLACSAPASQRIVTGSYRLRDGSECRARFTLSPVAHTQRTAAALTIVIWPEASTWSAGSHPEPNQEAIP